MPRRADRGDVPGGDAAPEGAGEEARGASAHRRRTNRGRGGRAARPGGDQGNRSGVAPRSVARRLRRPGRTRGIAPRDDRTVDGRDRAVVHEPVVPEPAASASDFAVTVTPPAFSPDSAHLART